jgi:replication initiator protein
MSPHTKFVASDWEVPEDAQKSGRETVVPHVATRHISRHMSRKPRPDHTRALADLAPDEYEQVKDIRRAIIERAKRELDAVADVTFRYEPVWEGKSGHARVVGWNFVAVGNTPRVAFSAGTRTRRVRIARAAAAAQGRQDDEAARRLAEPAGLGQGGAGGSRALGTADGARSAGTRSAAQPAVPLRA